MQSIYRQICLVLVESYYLMIRTDLIVFVTLTDNTECRIWNNQNNTQSTNVDKNYYLCSNLNHLLLELRVKRWQTKPNHVTHSSKNNENLFSSTGQVNVLKISKRNI